MPSNVLGLPWGWRGVEGVSNTYAITSVSGITGLSNSSAVISNSAGFLTTSNVTSTELSYSSGLVTYVQIQINDKINANASLPSSFSGNASATGRVVANAGFAGVGNGITNIFAGNVTSGFIPNSILPSNIAFNMVSAAGRLVGNGSALYFPSLGVGTYYQKANLHVIGDALFTGNFSAGGYQGNIVNVSLGAGNFTTGQISLTYLQNPIVVNSGGDTTASNATVTGNVVVSSAANARPLGTFRGVGSNLSSLDAGNFVRGTLQSTRLLGGGFSFSNGVTVGGSATMSNGYSLSWISNASSNSVDAALYVPLGAGRLFLGVSSSSFGNYACLSATNTGNVGITGCTAPKYSMDVTGTLRASGEIIMFSDARLKTDIREIVDSLDIVKSGQMRTYTFYRSDLNDDSRKVGLIAQEVESCLPDAVMEDSDGTLAVSYNGVDAINANALRILFERVEILKRRLESMTPK